jgi:hypothetical protein
VCKRKAREPQVEWRHRELLVPKEVEKEWSI